MLKRKIETTLRDFFRQNKQALLITGARQVGKNTFDMTGLSS